MTVSKSRARAGLRTGRVTASQALRVARSFGVTLDLSNDLELAGKWKHGWIPLDAVAAAVKAKRYHGGGGELVRGKARSGSLVESMRRPSVGRNKVKVGAPERAWRESSDDRVRRENAIARRDGPGNPQNRVAADFYRANGTRRIVAGGAESEIHHLDSHVVYTTDGRAISAVYTRPADPGEAMSYMEHQAVNARTPDRYGPSGAPFQRVDKMINGHRVRHDRGDDLNQWFVDNKGPYNRERATELVGAGHMETGKAHVYDPATGRAASADVKAAARRRASTDALVARVRERNATRPQPKVSKLGDAELQHVVTMYGTHSVQGEAARAEMARRAGGGAAGVKPVRGKVKRYVLERTLPDGSVKKSEPVTLAEAEQSMMGVLHYNQGVSKGEAGRLAPQLRHANVGEHVEAHGYKFRLVAVK